MSRSTSDQWAISVRHQGSDILLQRFTTAAVISASSQPVADSAEAAGIPPDWLPVAVGLEGKQSGYGAERRRGHRRTKGLWVLKHRNLKGRVCQSDGRTPSTKRSVLGHEGVSSLPLVSGCRRRAECRMRTSEIQRDRATTGDYEELPPVSYHGEILESVNRSRTSWQSHLVDVIGSHTQVRFT